VSLSTTPPVIGLVGGVGPAAGLEAARRVLAETVAARDADHVPLALLSFPDRIADRTAFLEGRTAENPGVALAEVVLTLERVGATVAGIACNTAHAPVIFDAMTARLRAAGTQIRVLHLIAETIHHLRAAHPQARRIGVLSTRSTHRHGLYTDALRAAGFVPVTPDAAGVEAVHALIYDPVWGLKACATPPHARAVEGLRTALDGLHAQGAEAVILGCTELGLCAGVPGLSPVPLVDPVTALARALLRATYPERLRPHAPAASVE
jgi:aspartate racemase